METGAVVQGAGRAPKPAGRRLGYLVAVVVNLGVLWIVNHLLDWQWPGFLTAEFDDVLPVLSASIVASVIVNLLWVAFDPPWLKALGGLVTSAFGVAVGVRTLEVFPFDFSTYAHDWSGLLRVVVVVGIVGSTVGVAASVVRLFTSTATDEGDTTAQA